MMSSIVWEEEWEYFDIDSEILDRLPINSKSLKSEFNEIILEIFRVVEYVKLNGAKNSPPMSKPKSYFKRLVYQFGCHYIDLKWKKPEARLRKLLRNTIASHGGRLLPANHSEGSDNLFYLCFRAIDPSERFVQRGEISRISKQLYFAHEKEVPQEYLIGFIYQTGGQQFDFDERRRIEEDWDDQEDIENPDQESEPSHNDAEVENDSSDEDWGI